MANRFTRFEPQEFTSLYTEIPYSAIAEVGAYKDKQYNEGQRQLSEFEQLLNVPALEQDTPIKKERIKYYEDQLNSSLDSVKGDYSRVIPAITRLKRELGKDLREGPLGAVVTNYSTDAESKKRLNELVDKKLIDVNTAEKLYKMDRSKYQGIGSQNSLGRFNNFNTTTPAEQIDLAEHFDKLAQGYKADKVASGGYRFSKDGKYIIKTDGSNEVVSDKQIASDLMRVAGSDPKIQAFVQQQALLDTYDKGQEFQDPNGNTSYYQIGNSAYPSKQDFQQLYSQELLNSPISFAASKHGYQSTSSDASIDADKYALKDYETEKSNELFRYSLPASTTPTDGTPGRVVTNADGSVLGQGEPSMVTSFIDNAVETGKSVLQGIWGAIQLSPASPFFDPQAGAVSMTKAQYNNVMSKVPSADRQEITDNSAKELREQFPVLKEMFPENKQKNSKGTYDANAAKAINFVHDAMMQNQTIVNHVDVPSEPTKNAAKAQLFNTGTFGKLNFKLSTGTLDTKNEALEQIGPLTKEKLDKAEFNGFGGFVDPGSIYAQVPNDDNEMVNITIEPDETTKSIYTHSNEASKVYKTGKPSSKVQTINDGTSIKQFIFDYVPTLDENGMTVKINQYEYNPENRIKKGNLISSGDAFEVYSQEYQNWLTNNKYKVK